MKHFAGPNVVYQLALRIGASYEAACWTLVRHRLIEASLARELLQTQPRTLKAALLETYRPQNYRGDVWLLTESRRRNTYRRQPQRSLCPTARRT